MTTMNELAQGVAMEKTIKEATSNKQDDGTQLNKLVERSKKEKHVTEATISHLTV